MDEDERREREQDAYEAFMLAVELAVLGILCKRLGKIDASTTYAALRAAETEDMAEVERVLGLAQGDLTERAGETFRKMGEECDEWAAPFFAYRGLPQPKVSEDVFLAQALESGWAKTEAELIHWCDSTVVQLYTNDGRLIPYKQAYRQYVDDAMLKVYRGEEYWYDSIAETVERIGRSGLRVRYESGATRELYSAVAQNVMDGYRDTMQAVRDAQAERFGADGIEVDAHPLCATDHLPYQGRRYTIAEFEEIQGGLRRPIGQWNCGHGTRGVILGVSAQPYTDAELETLAKTSARLTGFKLASGRELSAYEFSQWQRRQETSIRKLNAEAVLLEQAGQDGSRLRSKADKLLSSYMDASAKAGVRTRVERTHAYRLT